jgi:hypothetical protein
VRECSLIVPAQATLRGEAGVAIADAAVTGGGTAVNFSDLKSTTRVREYSIAEGIIVDASLAGKYRVDVECTLSFLFSYQCFPQRLVPTLLHER